MGNPRELLLALVKDPPSGPLTLQLQNHHHHHHPAVMAPYSARMASLSEAQRSSDSAAFPSGDIGEASPERASETRYGEFMASLLRDTLSTSDPNPDSNSTLSVLAASLIYQRLFQHRLDADYQQRIAQQRQRIASRTDTLIHSHSRVASGRRTAPGNEVPQFGHLDAEGRSHLDDTEEVFVMRPEGVMVPLASHENWAVENTFLQSQPLLQVDSGTQTAPGLRPNTAPSLMDASIESPLSVIPLSGGEDQPRFRSTTTQMERQWQHDVGTDEVEVVTFHRPSRLEARR